MKTEIKKQEDLTNVVNALVEVYGEDRAFVKMRNLLPRPEPLYNCSVRKGKNSRWLSGITAHDDAIVIHLSTESVCVPQWQAYIFRDILSSKLETQWSVWRITQCSQEVSQEVSQDG